MSDENNTTAVRRRSQMEHTGLKVVYLLINGINSNPGDAHGWNRRMASEINETTPYKADAFVYFSDTIFRRMFQNARVADLCKVIESYLRSGFEVNLVGHSNGCDIISRILLKRRYNLSQIHLIAGACEADCNKNGINKAIESGRLDQAFIYKSATDTALIKARRTSFLQWFGLGYGFIGLSGPENPGPDVFTVTRDGYDHSTWFDGRHFKKTTDLILEARK